MMGSVRRVMVNGPLVGPRPTGPAVHLAELLREMSAVRPELEIVSRLNSVRRADSNIASAGAIGPGVRPRTTRLPERWVRKAQERLRFPSERVLGGRYDVYHQFHTDTDPAVPSDRLVVTLHDTVALRWPQEEGQMYGGAGHLLRRAAAVITVSEYSKTAICEAFHVPRERVHVIYNGVRARRFQEPARRPTGVVDGPYVLYFGGHTPRKNIPRLIEAFALARRESGRRELRLVLAGPVIHAEPELRAGAPVGLPPDALVFPGYVPDADAVALYQHAELFAYPSLYEGFGLPVLEAMAAGAPAVIGNDSALPEVGGAAAVYVDAADPRSIARGILEVLSESRESRAHRQAAARDWAERFTWRRAAQDTLDVYDRIVSATR